MTRWSHQDSLHLKGITSPLKEQENGPVFSPQSLSYQPNCSHVGDSHHCVTLYDNPPRKRGFNVHNTHRLCKQAPLCFYSGTTQGKEQCLKKKPKIYIPKIEITKRTYGCGFRWWVDRGVVTSWWSMPEHIASSWQGGSHFCNWESGPRKE